MYLVRKRYSKHLKPHDIIASFKLNYQQANGKFSKLHIVVQKFI